MKQQSTVWFSWRILMMIATVASLGALWCSSQFAMSQREAWQHSKGELHAAQKRADNYLALNAKYANYKEFKATQEALLKTVNDRGLKPEQWSVRDLSMPLSLISRSEVVTYLKGVQSKEDHYFVPSQFTLKTQFAEDDLFNWKSADSNDVHLLLEGHYYIRSN